MHLKSVDMIVLIVLIFILVSYNFSNNNNRNLTSGEFIKLYCYLIHSILLTNIYQIVITGSYCDIKY